MLTSGPLLGRRRFGVLPRRAPRLAIVEPLLLRLLEVAAHDLRLDVGLAQATQKIGDVVTLIQNIAADKPELIALRARARAAADPALQLALRLDAVERDPAVRRYDSATGRERNL